jgi:hypothetical protein
MKFADEFMEEVRGKKSELMSMLSENYSNELERKLRTLLEKNWLSLPSEKSLKAREFAVDGSMAHRTLVNGSDLFFARALLIGDNGRLEKKKFRFEALRALEDPDEVSRFLRLLMGYLEVKIILDNIDELADSVVLMDGSLYGRFTHYYREILVSGFEDLPLKLISSMQELFHQCKERDVLLIGISKHSRSRVLSKALLGSLGVDMPPRMLPSDMEIIYRWRRDSPGYSKPLVLGDYAVYWEIDKLLEQPESFLSQYFPNIRESEAGWGRKVLASIPETPAMVMSYILPERGDSALRLDVPVNLLGDERKIGNVSPFEFADPKLIKHVISHLLASRGGKEVYNALLYVADREVRITRDTVDTVYKSIIQKELGIPVEYERGMRRFFG